MSEPSLAAILSDPYDDGARRAWASAVAVADPHRARFVEVQLALAKTQPHTPEAYALHDEARRLEVAHRQRWGADVAPLVDRFGFERGFVGYASLAADKLLQNAARLFTLAPIVDLRLTASAGRLGEVGALPEARRLRSLSLAGNRLGDGDARALAECASLAGLRWLDLSANGIGEAGLEALAASPHLRGIRWLGFASNAAPEPTPQVAADGPRIHAVTHPPLGEALRARHGDVPWLLAQWGSPPPRPCEV